MHARLLSFTLCWFLILCVGCGVFKPRTSLQAGPFGSYFSFEDNKDNDILVEKLEIDPTTKVLKADKITVRNNGSDPMRANVEQLKEVNEQLRTMGQNMAMFMQQLTSLAGTVAPWAARGSLNTPLGDVQIPAAVLDAAVQKALEKYGPPSPAPKPVP
jgi:hypothetical protein